MTLYRIDRPEGCNCPELKDIMPFRMADLSCPVHGVDPGGGDGYWKIVPVEFEGDSPRRLSARVAKLEGEVKVLTRLISRQYRTRPQWEGHYG